MLMALCTGERCGGLPLTPPPPPPPFILCFLSDLLIRVQWFSSVIDAQQIKLEFVSFDLLQVAIIFKQLTCLLCTNANKKDLNAKKISYGKTHYNWLLNFFPSVYYHILSVQRCIVMR